MVRIFVTLIELFFCFLLQTSLFSLLRISGVVPNCLLILTISVAYTRGQIPAMLTGFFAGLLLDLQFSETIGFCCILYMLIAFLAGYTHRFYDKQDFLIPGALIVSGEFVYSFLYYVIFFLLRGRLEFTNYFVYTILPRILYTTLLMLVLYPMFHGIHRLLLKLEGRNDD
ncbi:MAG: rod shape-determining protein MreD [Lachnospiraceae bacterium]|nr:rod shape-determining protein MreD [Lachnospiraceae bacterium]